jgi:hypothetical protein
MVHQKPVESRGIEEFRQNTTNPRTTKPPKSSPFAHGFGENQREKNHEGLAYIPHQIPKRKASKSLHETCQEKAPKITKKENWEDLKQALRNHAESSIHTMKVHTRYSFHPIILPSHKISP